MLSDGPRIGYAKFGAVSPFQACGAPDGYIHKRFFVGGGCYETIYQIRLAHVFERLELVEHLGDAWIR